MDIKHKHLTAAFIKKTAGLEYGRFLRALNKQTSLVSFAHAIEQDDPCQLLHPEVYTQEDGTVEVFPGMGSMVEEMSDAGEEDEVYLIEDLHRAWENLQKVIKVKTGVSLSVGLNDKRKAFYYSA